jgi:hypothetical protein
MYNEALGHKIIDPLDLEDSVVIDRLKQAILTSVLVYYSTHTARETCNLFGIPFRPEFVKILHRLHNKNMGLGGAREGSGQKKKIL